MEIKVLARRGTAVWEIARQTGLSRNTVRRYRRDEEARRYKPREPRATKLDPFKDYLLERVAAARPDWIPATVLLRELQEAGYAGGISQFKAFLAPRKHPEAEPVVRFETPPGKQMQADFTVIRRGRERLLALVATLGYSRASFVRFTAREDAATLCECLREALVYFGGTPEHVLFDNAKSVVIERDAFGVGEHRWNPQLLALAETYGFTPKVCRPYRAKTKGQGRAIQSLSQGELRRAPCRDARVIRTEAGRRDRQCAPRPMALRDCQCAPSRNNGRASSRVAPW